MKFVPVLQQLLGHQGEETESFDNDDDATKPARRRSSINGSCAATKPIKMKRRRRKKNHADDMSSSTTAKAADAKNRFQFAFVQFIRIISKYIAPVVMILDDLQWACSSTMDLLELLVSEQGTECILLVGIYRSNEVPQTHLLYKLIHETIQQKEEDGTLELTQVKIGNLEIDAVHEMIQDLLGGGQDFAQNRSLAQLCFKKTQGNAFFLLNYLALLIQLQLLKFDQKTMKWTWNETEVEAKTLSTDNVVDLLQLQMKELGAGLLNLLQLAACLGGSFDIQALTLVCEDEDEAVGMINRSSMTGNRNEDFAGVTFKRLRARLDQLVNFGFVVRLPFPNHGTYRWTHDSIQEAALGLIPKDKQRAFYTQIGTKLANFQNSCSSVDDSLSQTSSISVTESSQTGAINNDDMVFTIANLLNRGQEPTETKDRLNLARWNRDACLKSMSFSAFDASVTYATRGIACLPEKSWTSNSALAISLFSNGAKAHGSVGNTKAMEKLCKEMIAQPNVPQEEKLDVYSTWIDSLTNRGKVTEAAKLAVDVLKEFGCHMNKNTILVTCGILANFVRIHWTMKRRKPGDLSEMKDPTRIQLIRILDQVATCCYFSGEKGLGLLAIFRQLNWTMKYGYCEFSPSSFAATGLALIGVLNNLKSGAKYAKHALTLLERTGGSTEPRTLLVVGRSLLWTQPLRTVLKMMLKGYDRGLRSGDTESAAWCILNYLCMEYMLGSELETLICNLAMYGNQMKNLKRELASVQCKLMRQCYLNLAGKDNLSTPTNLHGRVVSEKELKLYAASVFYNDGVYLWSGVLKVYFGQYVEMADLILEIGHDYLKKQRPGTLNLMWDSCLKGVCCFHAARTASSRGEKRKQYTKVGNIIRARMKRWRRLGNPNLAHHIALLDAEWNVVKGDYKAAVQDYENSILIAARGDHPHDTAFASERLGEFHLEVLKDTDSGMNYIRQSLTYWREWGAHGKAFWLEQKHKCVSPQLEQSQVRK